MVMDEVRNLLSSKCIKNNAINKNTIRVSEDLWNDGYLIFYDNFIIIIDSSYSGNCRIDYVDPELFNKIMNNVIDFLGVMI